MNRERIELIKRRKHKRRHPNKAAQQNIHLECLASFTKHLEAAQNTIDKVRFCPEGPGNPQKRLTMGIFDTSVHSKIASRPYVNTELDCVIVDDDITCGSPLELVDNAEIADFLSDDFQIRQLVQQRPNYLDSLAKLKERAKHSGRLKLLDNLLQDPNISQNKTDNFSNNERNTQVSFYLESDVDLDANSTIMEQTFLIPFPTLVSSAPIMSFASPKISDNYNRYSIQSSVCNTPVFETIGECNHPLWDTPEELRTSFDMNSNISQEYNTSSFFDDPGFSFYKTASNTSFFDSINF